MKNGEHYLVTGQKIFITYGEHDMAENIVHLVLARTPDAPAGVRGISLFIVPKFLAGADGNPGKRNDLRCVSLEHKLGIHASPTCVMSFGDDGGAVGHLVGYDSPSQFNREYRRLFGAPPGQDAARLRAATGPQEPHDVRHLP